MNAKENDLVLFGFVVAFSAPIACFALLVTTLSDPVSTADFLWVPVWLAAGLYMFWISDKIRHRDGIVPPVGRMWEARADKRPFRALLSFLLNKGEQTSTVGFLLNAAAIVVFFSLLWYVIDLPWENVARVADFVSETGLDTNLEKDAHTRVAVVKEAVGVGAEFVALSLVMGWVFYLLFAPTVMRYSGIIVYALYGSISWFAYTAVDFVSDIVFVPLVLGFAATILLTFAGTRTGDPTSSYQ